ncbi:MAG: hypothetical protein COY39_01045 [Alphaproteobacteria bacterium CG_4_10_14_0_8_um_filter_37_21]|nr:MAG: hypothetical protein COY39_01045 [Alphaproteobacteria bacterium CG_4_10_14_0_8_um_filter_37_21]
MNKYLSTLALAASICSAYTAETSEAFVGGSDGNAEAAAEFAYMGTALSVAQQNASTGTLTSTGYRELKVLSEKLKTIEGTNGPIANKVLAILEPALLDLVNGVSARLDTHTKTALEVAAFFEGEGGSLAQKIMDHVAEGE